MRLGVPKEHRHDEHRVGLSPFGVSQLTGLGHDVYVQSGAGSASHFSDQTFREAGAQVVYQDHELYGRAEVICRVGPMEADEVELLTPDAVVCGFHHVATASPDQVTKLVERRVTLLAYELIEGPRGGRPILSALSEIAGQAVVHQAGRLLEHSSGGRGLLLGGLAGIPPATVVILGAGTVGLTAAVLFVAIGAHVIVLDMDHARLRQVHDRTASRAVTALATPRHVSRYARIADVLVAAALLPGGRAPYLVSEEIVRAMKRGSVILDVSIDQGGCVETSRPTTLDRPTFMVHDVIHYCVPNIPANTPRIASRAQTMVALPYLERLAGQGLVRACQADAGLAKGLVLYRGHAVHEACAAILGLDVEPLQALLGDEEGAS